MTADGDMADSEKRAPQHGVSAVIPSAARDPFLVFVRLRKGFLGPAALGMTGKLSIYAGFHSRVTAVSASSKRSSPSSAVSSGMFNGGLIRMMGE